MKHSLATSRNGTAQVQVVCVCVFLLVCVCVSVRAAPVGWAGMLG